MARRIKLLFLGLMAFTISMLVYTSHLRDAHPPDQRSLQDFYHKTKTALDTPAGKGGGKGGKGAGEPLLANKDKPQVVDLDNDGDVDEEDVRLAREMAARLKAAEQEAKERANAKAPNKPESPSDVIGVGSSASGQKKTPQQQQEGGVVGGSSSGGVVGSSNSGGVVGGSGSGTVPDETETDHAVESELDAIIKKAPVIIFSKSYCPYSKRAKGLLLEKYVIEPPPYVVELDQHPLGPQLQARLAELTGRRTVPNILVSGKSIGGGDDIAELDTQSLLVDKVKSIGGKLVEMKVRTV